MTNNIKTWCCLDKGESRIQASVGKNVYYLGETVEACAEIDNEKCDLDIQNITVSLCNNLTLRADGRTRTFNLECLRSTFQGVEKGEKAVGEKMIRLFLNI